MAIAPEPGSDEALMASYLAGDTDAFRRLFARYRGPLHRLMRRAVSDHHDAEELVQQTFLQLHRARDDFRTDSSLRPWLYTIALNVRHQYVRTTVRHRRKVRALSLERRGSATLPPDLLLHRLVHRALAALPVAQRTVVELHWFGGLSFGEIAERLGATPVAVRLRAHRGYRRLRESLG
ncbi:MAG: RNA polymerase sigma factor [Deltaproteobacteria bacterium]|nr:RNA polymerase sigma factor [Deltaproteobacteria bacterium]